MRCYLVGGAVRDRLLGMPVRERDWVVVGATERELLAQGFRRIDGAFPVFLHPETGEEYALARTETKSGPGYKGFVVDAGPDVTLEQDLARRDLTINAIAEDADGRLIDPFNGRDDLDQGLLRHVSPAFVEDPVRLLRIARFAARLGRWGFHVAHRTHDLLRQMAASDDLLTLTRDRIWLELRKALASDQPGRFFEVLHRCGALARLLPEVAAGLGAPDAHQRSAPTGPLAALERAAAAGASPATRFAVLAAACGKDPERTAAFLETLPVDRKHRELALALARCRCALAGEPGPEALLGLLERERAFTRPDALRERIAACLLLEPDLQRNARRLLAALERAASVTLADLSESPPAGPEAGRALHRLRLQAIENGR